LSAKGSTLPIIFITGFEDPLARGEALKSGAIAFLQKPMDEQTLLGAIEAASQRPANRN
jgi:two-component system response regulator FixJ